MNQDITIGFTLKICGSCGVAFWIPDVVEAECLKTKKTWYCPNGHARAYIESEADKYKKLYEQEKEEKYHGIQRNIELNQTLGELEIKLEKCNKKTTKGKSNGKK